MGLKCVGVRRHVRHAAVQSCSAREEERRFFWGQRGSREWRVSRKRGLAWMDGYVN